MKKSIKKWSIRLFSFGFISILSIVIAVLNPNALYANKTELGNYIIYHQTDLPPEFESRLDRVNSLVLESELYSGQKLKICLNDGSFYPELIRKLRGPAFGWGFHNITTYNGKFNFQENTVELNGYKWNLEQLLVHELTHCLQFTTLGLFEANPLGNHPNWKWEGYAEYISRKNDEQLSLVGNIERMELVNKENRDTWGVFFEDGTVTPRTYYQSWLLVQYCLDIKKMSYVELLDSSIPKSSIQEGMNNWYRNEIKEVM